MLERRVSQWFPLNATEMNFICLVRRHHCVYKPTDKMAKLPKISGNSPSGLCENVRECMGEGLRIGQGEVQRHEGGLHLS